MHEVLELTAPSPATVTGATSQRLPSSPARASKPPSLCDSPPWPAREEVPTRSVMFTGLPPDCKWPSCNSSSEQNTDRCAATRTRETLVRFRTSCNGRRNHMLTISDTDIVGNNIPVFFIQDAIQFPDLIHSVKPRPDNEIPTAATAHDSAWDFFSSQPSTMHTLFWAMAGFGIPRSYRHMVRSYA
jgi:hypothetical protein